MRIKQKVEGTSALGDTETAAPTPKLSEMYYHMR